MNINAKPAPFDLQRVDPLTAVLYGVRKSTLSTSTLTLDETKTLAQNIYDHVPRLEERFAARREALSGGERRDAERL